MKRSEFVNVLSGSIAFLSFISMLFCMLFYFRFRDSFHGFFEFIFSFSEVGSGFSSFRGNFDPTTVDTGMFYFFVFINIARLLTIFNFILASIWMFLGLATSSLQLVQNLIKVEVLDAFSTMIGVFVSISILSFFFWLISKLMSQPIKREFLQKV